METNQPLTSDERLKKWLDDMPEQLRLLFTDYFLSKPLEDEPASVNQHATLENPAAPLNKEMVAMLQMQSELLKSLQDKIGNIGDSIQDFSYKDEINTRLHDELQKYKSGLRKEFVTPLLKSITREYDHAVRQYKFYAQEQENHGEAFANLLKQFKETGLRLLDLLSDYDLEPFEPKEGDPYSAKEHRIVEIIETAEAAKDNTIAACVACGFRDISNERLMRHAEVNIYKQK